MTGFYEGGSVSGEVVPHNLNDHLNVNTVPLEGDILTYNSVTQLWESEQPAATVLDLDDLTDVTLTSPLDNQILAYNDASSTWVNVTQGAGSPIGMSDLTDTTISSPVNGDRLEYQGGFWINVSSTQTTEPIVTVGNGADNTDAGVYINSGTVNGDLSTVAFQHGGSEAFRLESDPQFNLLTIYGNANPCMDINASTGKVRLYVAPTVDLDAANKEYVDGAVAAAVATLDARLIAGGL